MWEIFAPTSNGMGGGARADGGWEHGVAPIFAHGATGEGTERGDDPFIQNRVEEDHEESGSENTWRTGLRDDRLQPHDNMWVHGLLHRLKSIVQRIVRRVFLATYPLAR